MNFSKFKNHFLVIVIGIIMVCIYYKPIFEGKVLQQSDVIQASAMQHEIWDFKSKTGHHAMWVNNLFSGMPAFMIAPDYSTSFISNILAPFESFFKGPLSYTLYYFIGFYILMVALGFSPWLSCIGAIMFTFSSYNIIIIEAGHTTKARCIAFIPAIIAGILMLFKRKYVLGSILISLFLYFSIRSNHPQIVYYMFLSIGIYFLYQFVESILQKQLKQFFVVSIIFTSCVILAVSANFSQLWVTYEYSKDTMRGGSELAIGNTSSSKSTKGLDKNYAFAWSYGKLETLTMLIPNLFGGASGGMLKEDSKVYSELVNAGVPENNALQFAYSMPTYWGAKVYKNAQSSTSGPVYLGAIVCFLFVLGIFIIKERWKWWIFATTVLSILLSWGNNFAIFNNLFYDIIPLYNKFRTVEMSLILCQFTFAFFAMHTLKKIIDGEEKNDAFLKKLKTTLIIFIPILLLFALVPSIFLDFNGGDGDNRLRENLLANGASFADKIILALQSDRADMVKLDAWRSLIFILIAAITLWAFVKQKIKSSVVITIIGLATLIDLWNVDRRFLNDEKFIDADNVDNNYLESAADQQILQDKTLSFRVFNYNNPFNDALPSYHHKNIGGYNPAKLSRYQDLIDSCIGKGNQNVINMLNTKYYIGKTSQGADVAQINPGAIGNAWFVDTLKYVNSPREEIMALKTFNPLHVAIVDVSKNKEFIHQTYFEKDSAASISLIKNELDLLEYKFNATKQQATIFSEVFYADKKGKGWQAYLDGRPVDHFRVNYILRAMIIPAGKHIIEFKFEPKSFLLGQKISFIGSLLLSLLILFGIYHWWRSNRNIISVPKK